MKNLALHWKILIGMALGILAGTIAIQFAGGKEFILDWVEPFGKMFINCLKLVAVPLIIASLIKGISDLKDISKLSQMGGKTVVLYLTTTVLTVTLGLILVNIIQPGKWMSEATVTELKESYKEDANAKIELANEAKDSGPLQFFVDIVPENIFEASRENKNMLQVIFFVVFFGIGLILIPEEQGRPIKEFFDGLNEVILKLIDLIMLASPLGVFALLAALIAKSPSSDIFFALGAYCATVILGLATMIFIIYPLFIKVFTGRNPLFFFKGIAPAQLVAFSTSSSAATLPVTMECTEERLGVDREITSFVLPIGATVNMDGTSLYQAVAAVFVAQAFGMDLSLEIQLGIIITATLASIGSAAVPSAGMVMLVIVLGQAGIPEAGLALIFAVDRPLDMCRTIVNVTGDAMVAMVVAKSVGKLRDESEIAS